MASIVLFLQEMLIFLLQSTLPSVQLEHYFDISLVLRTSSVNLPFPLSYAANFDVATFPLCPTARSTSCCATTLLSSSSSGNVKGSDRYVVKLPFDNSSTVKFVPVVIFPTFTEP